jgi:hypothetical protein
VTVLVGVQIESEDIRHRVNRFVIGNTGRQIDNDGLLPD